MKTKTLKNHGWQTHMCSNVFLSLSLSQNGHSLSLSGYIACKTLTEKSREEFPQHNREEIYRIFHNSWHPWEKFMNFLVVDELSTCNFLGIVLNVRWIEKIILLGIFRLYLIILSYWRNFRMKICLNLFKFV